MIDPATGRFWASWQDEDAGSELENADFAGAEPAIAWGRERSDRVYIRLGHTEETYFSAGAVHPPGASSWPPWPPPAPPPDGWWVPPTVPTLAEAQAVAVEAARGERSAQDAATWAWERTRPALQADTEQEVMAVLLELTSGWFYENGQARPVSEIDPGS
jgi:hypothetical protein